MNSNGYLTIRVIQSKGNNANTLPFGAPSTNLLHALERSHHFSSTALQILFETYGDLFSPPKAGASTISSVTPAIVGRLTFVHRLLTDGVRHATWKRSCVCDTTNTVGEPGGASLIEWPSGRAQSLQMEDPKGIITSLKPCHAA